MDRLDRRWSEHLRGVEFAVEEVPPPDAPRPGGGPVARGRSYPATPTSPARVVVYRRPVEARASDRGDLATLVHDVVVEAVADLLGLEPGQIDPTYGARDED